MEKSYDQGVNEDLSSRAWVRPSEGELASQDPNNSRTDLKLQFSMISVSFTNYIPINLVMGEFPCQNTS
jgi:hypothetical protein